jgi:hypothetical protein
MRARLSACETNKSGYLVSFADQLLNDLRASSPGSISVTG